MRLARKDRQCKGRSTSVSMSGMDAMDRVRDEVRDDGAKARLNISTGAQRQVPQYTLDIGLKKRSSPNEGLPQGISRSHLRWLHSFYDKQWPRARGRLSFRKFKIYNINHTNADFNMLLIAFSIPFQGTSTCLPPSSPAAPTTPG